MDELKGVNEDSRKQIERPAFTPLRLQEERDRDVYETISIKFNAQERADLEGAKKLLDIGPDSAVIKQLMAIGRKVIHDQFSPDFWRYINSQKRTRYDGRKARR